VHKCFPKFSIKKGEKSVRLTAEQRLHDRPHCTHTHSTSNMWRRPAGRATLTLQWQIRFRQGIQRRCFSASARHDHHDGEDRLVAAAMNFVRAFRTYGHAVATLDPLGLTRMPSKLIGSFGALFESMDAGGADTGFDFSGFRGLETADQVRLEEAVVDAFAACIARALTFDDGSLVVLQAQIFSIPELHCRSDWTLPELARFMRQVYAGPVGVEYGHVADHFHKRWLRSKLEAACGGVYIPEPSVRRAALHQLIDVELFEHALADMFPASKR